MSYINLIPIPLLSFCLFQTALACSPAPYNIKPTPTEFDTVNKFINTDSVIAIKVIKVKRDPDETNELNKRILETNNLIDSKIDNTEYEIDRIERELTIPNNSVEMKLKAQNLAKIYESLLSSFNAFETEKFFYSEIYGKFYRGEEPENSEDELFILTQKIINSKKELISIQSKLKIIELNRDLNRKKLRLYKTMITSLIRQKKTLVDNYRGPLNIKMEVIHSYKGIIQEGKIITKEFNKKSIRPCFGNSINHLEYSLKDDDLIIIYNYDFSKYSSNNIKNYKIARTEKAKQLLLNKMIKVANGTYRDNIFKEHSVDIRVNEQLAKSDEFPEASSQNNLIVSMRDNESLNVTMEIMNPDGTSSFKKSFKAYYGNNFKIKANIEGEETEKFLGFKW